jgi:hypothetical protein
MERCVADGLTVRRADPRDCHEESHMVSGELHVQVGHWNMGNRACTALVWVEFYSVFSTCVDCIEHGYCSSEIS